MDLFLSVIDVGTLVVKVSKSQERLAGFCFLCHHASAAVERLFGKPETEDVLFLFGFKFRVVADLVSSYS